jgi:hypothetical protein
LFSEASAPRPARPSVTNQQWKSHSRRARRSTRTKASPRRAMIVGDKHTQYSCTIVLRPLRVNYVRPGFLHGVSASLIRDQLLHTRDRRRLGVVPRPKGLKICVSIAKKLSLRNALAPKTCKMARILERPRQTGTPASGRSWSSVSGRPICKAIISAATTTAG